MKKSRSSKFKRAKVRHALITRGANMLTGGRLLDRHLEDEVVVRCFDVALPHWPAELDGIRVGHLSDLHMGELMPQERVTHIVSLLNDANVDLVAFTGDAVDLEHDGISKFFEALADVHAPAGHHFIMGNHDYLDDGDAVIASARAAGVNVLIDESIEIDVGRARPLRLAGIDWAKRLPELSDKVKQFSGECDLLLAHNPKAFIEAAREAIPLTLAGHTHGGQVALRGRPERNLAVAHRLSAGFYERNGSALFVTTGVGAWFPLRVHCPPEVVVLTLRRGDWIAPSELGD